MRSNWGWEAYNDVEHGLDAIQGRCGNVGPLLLLGLLLKRVLLLRQALRAWFSLDCGLSHGGVGGAEGGVEEGDGERGEWI
jgi:hypothetical protein